MVGGGVGVTVKIVLVAVPPGVVTVIEPVTLPLPTVAVSEVELVTEKESAAVPPKATAVAPVKLAPVIATTNPGGPLLGVNDAMVGGKW